MHIFSLTLASLEYEGDTVPSPVFNVRNHGTERRASRFFGHYVVIFVRRLVAIVFLYIEGIAIPLVSY